MRWLFFTAVLGLLSCSASRECSPSNCDGCCSFSGSCVTGDSVDACGKGGLSCTACDRAVMCVDGVCGGTSSGGGTAGGSGGSGGGTGTGKSKSASIGPDGGVLELEGARVEVPAGALPQATTLTITSTTLPVPAGYQAYSPVYRFEPEGLAFAAPVTVRLPYSGDQRIAVLFHSERGSTSRFERIVGTSAASVLTAQVTHFSLGFVGNGVDYTEQGDRSCTVARLLEGRVGSSNYSVGLDGGTFDAGTPIPGGVSLNLSSSVALIFSIEDCQGRPLTGLAEQDFVLKEDGATLSVEANKRILPARGLTTFATLVLDVSSSTQSVLPQLVSGARAFVQKLQVDRGLQVPIAIELFAGMPQSVVWQAPTLDTQKLLQRLDAVAAYRAPDMSSTNLNGAVVDALSRLQQSQAAYVQRNQGGAFSTGFVVLFTDGADTAGRISNDAVLSTVRASSDRVLALALRSPDFDAVAEQRLRDLTSGAYLVAPTTTVLDLEFSSLAARIAGQASRTYLLGYCSPKRSGQHQVSVEVSSSTTMQPAQYSFNANGFTPGCSADAFNLVCLGKQCGGLGCGGCDDRVASCAASGLDFVCRSFCDANNQCGGQMFMNSNGYQQACADRPQSTQCMGTCVNTLTSATHCGGCNVPCGANGLCANGSCSCQPGYSRCAGMCLSTTSDPMNCGGCGVVCGSTATCLNSRCVTQVAAFFPGTSPFSVGPSHLAFCSGTNVVFVPSSGGAATTVPLAGTCRSSTVDGTHVYVIRTVSTLNRLSRVPLAGGAIEDLATGLPVNAGVSGLVQDGANLLFSSSTTVYRATKTLGTPCTITAPAVSAPRGDGTNVYWLGAGQNLYRAPCPGTPTLLANAPGTSATTAFAVQGGFLWYLGSDAVKRVPLAGGSVQDVYPVRPNGDQSFVLDAASVFWGQFSNTGLEVVQAPTAGGPPTSFLNQGYQFLGLDPQFLYFANSGVVYRTAR